MINKQTFSQFICIWNKIIPSEKETLALPPYSNIFFEIDHYFPIPLYKKTFIRNVRVRQTVTRYIACG